ncbi:MAG TPA: hypothetical protein DIT64_01695 [Verrucomicrobiales bacterium]|nr:hypothetical protein [Verrucomicrobiales bacterium]HCN79287.1 hypothetical protein [Verrucomicrobiales bacterium]
MLGAFASFAVLFWVIQTFFVTPGDADPRAAERLANSAEISALQKDVLAKMGLSDPAKKAAVFDKTLQVLKTRPESASGQVVPGSPTQLKQAAEAPPAAGAAPAPSATPQN